MERLNTTSNTNETASEVSEVNKIFVYGTLRKGFYNHHFLEEDTEFIGKAKSVNEYKMTAREYIIRGGRKRAVPFVSKTPECSITGEIYEVSNNTLKLLDRLENHPFWYVREEVEFVLTEDNTDGEPKVVKAWIYFNELDKGEIDVESGDFEISFPKKA
mmetsp:Transcript_43205/g.50051  ORF Transcript_43205/g.50051 Transcript_43205/m.50051 type:complete len:159 (+) Transcript_43205:46-522(+)